MVLCRKAKDSGTMCHSNLLEQRYVVKIMVLCGVMLYCQRRVLDVMCGCRTCGTIRLI